MKIKPGDVKSGRHTDYVIEHNDKDHVPILTMMLSIIKLSKYKNIFAKSCNHVHNTSRLLMV